jgi:hypothetical protein
MVRAWYGHLSPDTPTLRAHAYGVLRAILQTAVYDGEITANPAHTAAPAPPTAPWPSPPPRWTS